MYGELANQLISRLVRIEAVEQEEGIVDVVSAQLGD
jgi:hypothetical protein